MVEARHPQAVSSVLPTHYGSLGAGITAGWVSAKGRVPYAILALMDALRAFPGQVRRPARA